MVTAEQDGHRPRPIGLDVRCWECNWPWPCPTIRRERGDAASLGETYAPPRQLPPDAEWDRFKVSVFLWALALLIAVLWGWLG